MKFDLFAACVEYLMTLEYLVSRQCEKLNLMEVEGYERRGLLWPSIAGSECRFILKFWYFIFPNCHIYCGGCMAIMSYEDWRLKIVLYQIENDQGILVSIVYKLPLISYHHVNLASIVHWDSHNLEYTLRLLFLKF